ncbi:amino acid ABC transporter permease [Longirhabdus pacifica]|uniref:amino acid ABC transporter permease n=1 Tax=Longirhabdus pacifica TaxID=2305227 RepID=UPI0010093302|nr:amino acid ABC transporter permease [Longirhabdus pacifica]
MYLTNSNEQWERLFNIAIDALPPMLEGAIFYTIPLSIISFIVGIVLALLTAFARISSVTPLQMIARVYVSAIRGTPLLVQLFIIFYALPAVGVTLDPFPTAVIGFSLNVGAYASEIIRAAIQSIPKGQWEAASSIGMSYRQALFRIILPQATRVSVPPLSNTFISLVKDTSLASLILVTEMFQRAKEVAAATYEVLFVYSLAALLYWIICFILSILQDRMERRLDRYVSTN